MVFVIILLLIYCNKPLKMRNVFCVSVNIYVSPSHVYISVHIKAMPNLQPN